MISLEWLGKYGIITTIYDFKFIVNLILTLDLNYKNLKG